jgi:hypothetical protein
MRKSLLKTLLLCCLLPFSPAPMAEPTLYPQPLTPRFEAGDDQLSCHELDRQIAQQMPQTYGSKPGFYDDPYHGAAIWGGVIWAPAALGYLPYSGVAEYEQYSRIQAARNRIEALRYLKARRRCYE